MNIISPIKFNNRYNVLNHNHQNNSSNFVAMKGILDKDEFIKHAKTGETGEIIKNGQVYNYHTTSFLREDIIWSKLFDYIGDRFKNAKKVNVYDYACSEGLEAYTISMCLQKTQKNPKRFFPISAKDIKKVLIEANNYNKEHKEAKFFDKCLEYKFKKNFPNEDFYSHQYFNMVYDDVLIPTIKITDKTTDPVEFSYGNILDDVDKLDNKNPTLLFARNMWPYVDSKEYNKFAKKLYSRLKEGSVVVIGTIDTKFSDALEKAGFEPKLKEIIIEKYDDDFCVVYEKN